MKLTELRQIIREEISKTIDRSVIDYPDRMALSKKKDYKSILQKWVDGGSKGVLDLKGTNINTFPSNIKEVPSNLYLAKSDIEKLPNNFKVGGTLFINNTNIKSLPKGLQVGRDLVLFRSAIEDLPEDIIVKGNVKAYSNDLIAQNYTEEELKDKCPGIKGEVEF